MHLPRCPSLG